MNTENQRAGATHRNPLKATATKDPTTRSSRCARSQQSGTEPTDQPNASQQAPTPAYTDTTNTHADQLPTGSDDHDPTDSAKVDGTDEDVQQINDYSECNMDSQQTGCHPPVLAAVAYAASLLSQLLLTGSSGSESE